MYTCCSPHVADKQWFFSDFKLAKRRVVKYSDIELSCFVTCFSSLFLDMVIIYLSSFVTNILFVINEEGVDKYVFLVRIYSTQFT